MREWLRDVLARRPALDERAARVLRVHELRLHAVRLLREAGRARRGSVVRGRADGARRQGDRAAALGDLRGGDLRLLADAPVDVAVGGALRGAGGDRDGAVAGAPSRRRERPGCWAPISFVPFAALSVALWKRARSLPGRRAVRCASAMASGRSSPARRRESAPRSRGRSRARASRWCWRAPWRTARGARRRGSRRNTRWRRASCRSISRRPRAPSSSRRRSRISRSPCSSTTPASATRAASSASTSSGSSR